MLAEYEDDIICDFAQYYHVFDWRQLSVKMAAVLACGLPADSRTVKSVTHQTIDIKTMLLAAIADHSALLVWSKTKDAQRHRNQPKSYLKILTTKKKERSERSFASGEAFEAERRRLIEG